MPALTETKNVSATMNSHFISPEINKQHIRNMTKANLFEVKSVMSQAFEEGLETNRYLSSVIPKGMDNMERINEVVENVNKKFKDLRSFKGPVLKHLYNMVTENEEHYKEEAVQARYQFRNVPNMSLYQQIKMTKQRTKNEQQKKKMERFEMKRMEDIRTKKKPLIAKYN